MASLSMNVLLDRFKQKFLEMHGDKSFRDHRLRVQQSYQDFTLSAAQMDTLNATPVTVLAAPGAGLVNIILGCLFKVNSTGFTRFELGSGVISLLLTDGSGAKVTADLPNTEVESATDLMYWAISASVDALANAVVVAKASADVTAGTGNVQGRLFYMTCKHSELA